MVMTEESKPDAPGWDAIDRALAPIYAGQTPRHMATIVPSRLGGPDPLDGISVYRRDDPVPHWHYVTYGFSELYDKESEDRDCSGWGFELTFRLMREVADDEPPMWPFNFLQNLARYVFGSGRTFAAGDHMNLNGPIALGQATSICAILFATDPELPAIDTAHGRLEFLQVVGITTDEGLAARQWRAEGLLGALRESQPLLVTDLQRTCAMSTPVVRQTVERGARVEGSSTGFTLVNSLDWAIESRLFRKPVLRVTVGANAVRDIQAVLPGRARFGRPYSLVGKGCRVDIATSDSADRHSAEDRTLRLALRPSVIDALCAALQPKAGSYPVGDIDDVRLVIVVVRTEIRDADGNVVATIG